MNPPFGTDGIRAPADAAVFTPASLLALGQAWGQLLAEASPEAEKVIYLGRDTRESGPRLLEGFSAGLMTEGFTVVELGVLPTPALAWSVRESGAASGVMATASHNPHTDNGLKFFTAEGRKLPLDLEASLASRYHQLMAVKDAGTSVNQASQVSARESLPSTSEWLGRYRDFARGDRPGDYLDGWRIVVDSAHGATSETTAAVLRQLGAEVITMGDAPDGTNINAGVGSEHPEAVAAAVQVHEAQLGLAHDGDGDRAVMIDHTGAILPGEAVLGVLALSRKEQNLPGSNLLVTTIQANGGLDAALRAAGVKVLRTDVGDRHVADAMFREEASWGGESSGHFLLGDRLLSGDGLLAALALIDLMRQTGQPLELLRRAIPLFPQANANLRVREKIPFAEINGWAEQLEAIRTPLPTGSRLLIRYSGTEPKIRLLAEAPRASLAEKALQEIIELVRASLEVVD